MYFRWTFMEQMSKEFLISYCLEPDVIITFCTPCTDNTIDLKFLLFTLWNFCTYYHNFNIKSITLPVFDWFSTAQTVSEKISLSMCLLQSLQKILYNFFNTFSLWDFCAWGALGWWRSNQVPTCLSCFTCSPHSDVVQLFSPPFIAFVD